MYAPDGPPCTTPLEPSRLAVECSPFRLGLHVGNTYFFLKLCLRAMHLRTLRVHELARLQLPSPLARWWDMQLREGTI